MKRSNSPITEDDSGTKKLKIVEQESCNGKSELVDESTLAESSTSLRMDCFLDTQVSNSTEDSIIPAVRIPQITMKKSKNSEAHLRLINDKFGELRIRKAGRFIKLFADDNDMYQELITFLTANEIEYLNLKNRMHVVITGLTSDMTTQQIKEALATEKDFDVEKVVHLKDRSRKLPPFFQVVLPHSDKNKNILNLTDLLNLKISVENIPGGKLRKFFDKLTREKGTAKSETEVPISVDCVETGTVAPLSGKKKKSDKVRKKNLRNLGTANVNMIQTSIPCQQKKKEYQELSCKNNNMDVSEIFTDLQDIIYIMQEFRKLFGKIIDVKAFAQKLKNSSSIEKFAMFSKVFLD